MFRHYKLIFAKFLMITPLLAFSQPKATLTSNTLSANSFEGSINFFQKTPNDTFYYTYYIKDKNVRVDIHENCGNCKEADSYLLFNLEKKTILALNPERKLYLQLPLRPYKKSEDKSYQIIKTNNKKLINGYTCYQWRVKNASQNTEITYWVTNDNFTFFEEFLTLWNRSEKHAYFYLQIPESIGYFPMESVERTLLRDEKMKLSVINLKKGKLDNSLFEIPKDYRSYDQ